MMPSSATRPRTLKILRGEPPRVAANGTTTQRFFAEGDLHEGTQWKYARLPPDDAVETNSDTEFDSFDKIPRKRSMVLAFLAIAAFLLVGSAAWTMMFRSTMAGVVLRSWVSSTFAAHAKHKEPAPPPEAPAMARPSALPETQQTQQTQQIVARTETEQRQPSTQLEHSESNEEHRAPAAAASPLPSSSVAAASAPSPSPPQPQRVGRQPATSAHPGAGAHPLRGFVWSPAIGGLAPAVRADPVPAVPADPADPAGSADPAVPAPDPSP
jgi:hypothetical protein